MLRNMFVQPYPSTMLDSPCLLGLLKLSTIDCQDSFAHQRTGPAVTSNAVICILKLRTTRFEW